MPDVKDMMQSVRGQHVWIIGASSGIGAATALALSKAGAHVILSARRADVLEHVGQQLYGFNHQILPFDVASYAETVVAFSKIKRLDRVLFLAAVYDPTIEGRTDIAFIQQSLQVNLAGVFHIVNVVTSFFEGQGYGQINLCGSVAGYFGLPNAQPYSATKAAIINLAESLYIENQAKNIDVKLISPGFVRTPMTDKNDFEMPMMISVEAAAEAILAGMTAEAFEIHFPKKFTWLVKVLRFLPYYLSFKLSKILS